MAASQIPNLLGQGSSPWGDANFLTGYFMKKLISIAIISFAGIANAGEVTASYLTDSGRDGYAISTNIKGITLETTHVDRLYNRFSVGKLFDIAKVGPVQLAAGGAAVYQNTLAKNDSGYGLSAQATATATVNKNVDLVAGVQKFMGQDRVNAQEGNTATFGLKVKF